MLTILCCRYATQQLDSDYDNFRNRDAGTQPGLWYLKWTICPNCNQPYDNDLGLALSAGYVQYIEQKDGLFHIRDFLIVESYMTLLIGLKDAVHIDDSYFEEMEQVQIRFSNASSQMSRRPPPLFHNSVN